MHHFSPDRVLPLLREAIAIDSVNRTFRENRAGETSLCDWVEIILQRQGIACRSQPIKDRLRNLVATVAGRDPSRTICFEAHLDTTTARGMAVHPFAAELVEGRVYGRGACDCKGALAAMLAALQTVANDETPPPFTVAFAATVDREIGLTGIQRLLASGFRPTYAVVGAPTNLAVAACARGCLRWRIAVGESPQSYAPARRNAISDAVLLIGDLERRIRRRAAEHPHPLLGEAELRPWRIRASGLEGFLPPHCAVDFDCYTVPDCDADAILDEVNDAVTLLEADEPGIRISVEAPYLNEPPVQVAETAPLVRAALDVCHAAAGPASLVGLRDNGHLNRFVAAGIEAVALGPGDPALARATQECVEVEQLAAAADIYYNLMRNPPI
ncbi:MAG: M20/M25/M40 family metallo-hydrolase [Candidatus Sumerlaeia bacterium]|nr:M20/M25/M40 family metallo-hydrolase [Candidatus Sumerlaeia bacterium]